MTDEKPAEWQVSDNYVYRADPDVQRALEAGARSHLLTIGSPARGICLRITLGRCSRRGKWHPYQPCVFLIVGGKRWGRWMGAGL